MRSLSKLCYLHYFENGWFVILLDINLLSRSANVPNDSELTQTVTLESGPNPWCIIVVPLLSGTISYIYVCLSPYVG